MTQANSDDANAIEGEIVDLVGKPMGALAQTRRAGNKIKTAERRITAIRMSAAGYSLSQIQRALGYSNNAAVSRDLTRAREQVMERLATAVAEHRAQHLLVLEDALMAAQQVLHTRHILVSGGKPVYRVTKFAVDEQGNVKLDEDGNPLAQEVVAIQDDGPTLAAAAQIVRISESMRKLLGLDAPAKVDITGTVQHSYGVDIDEV